MAKQVRLDKRKITDKAEKAFKTACLLMSRQFTFAISKATWSYPVPPSPRDIVDSGQLRASQLITFVTPSHCIFSWNVDYALYVHEGYTTTKGTQIPGRPWTEAVIAKDNFLALYAQAYKSIPD